MQPHDAQTVLLSGTMNCTNRQTHFTQCLLCSFVQPVQLKQQVNSAIRQCALSATALQRLQDARPLDI